MFLPSPRHRLTTLRPLRCSALHPVKTDLSSSQSFFTAARFQAPLTSTRSESFFISARSKSSSITTRSRSFFTPTTPRKMGNTLSSPLGLHQHPLSLTASLLQSPFRPIHHYSSYSGYYGSNPSSVMGTYWLLLAINGAVFGAYHYSQYTGDRKLESKILKNTLLSLSSWDQNLWWTTITSTFTHQDIFHIAFNMMTLHTTCSILSTLPFMTAPHILSLTLAAGIAGSGGYLYHQSTKTSSSNSPSSRSQAYYTPAIGASGYVMGIATLTSCLLPRFPVQFFLIPIRIPIWCTTVLYGLVDSYYLDDKSSRVAHAGHLGGLVAGVVYSFVFFRRAPCGVWAGLARMFGRRR